VIFFPIFLPPTYKHITPSDSTLKKTGSLMATSLVELELGEITESRLVYSRRI
jgi:hypothetical protein